MTTKDMEQSDTIERLQKKASDLRHLERHFGREQVQSIGGWSKALEQAERANKRPKCDFEMSRWERGLTGYGGYGEESHGAAVC